MLSTSGVNLVLTSGEDAVTENDIGNLKIANFFLHVFCAQKMNVLVI